RFHVRIRDWSETRGQKSEIIARRGHRARAPSRSGICVCSPVQISGLVDKKSDQRPAAALARSLALHLDRKTFISALTATIRFVTPLYFLVAPVTVLVTAPWWTRLCNFS